jgi:hypothetical protein
LRKEKTVKTDVESHKQVCWKELLGFDKDRGLLQELLREERLPTVLLFEGKEGIGKSTLLYFLAALHFCETQNACGTCSSCWQVANNQHPDLLVVRGAGEALKVSSISEVGEFMNYAPQSPSRFAKRLVLIIDAEDLTLAAVNKLLKTLEEPSASSRIFISTSRMRKLLPTFLSRCVHWHVKPPSLEDVIRIVVRAFPHAQTEETLKELIFRFGNSPSQVMRHLVRNEQSQQAHQLIQCRKVGEILNFAETFRQQGDVSLGEFMREFEYALNKFYREVSETQDVSQIGQVFERRLFLRELKKLVNKQKIAVSPQMVVEKLGFFNLQISVKTHGRG